MIFSYYPGCTLKTKGKELDIYARKSAEALGVTMEELEEWQCCGAVYPMASDEIASRLSAIRALDSAKAKGQKLLTLCSACHHVIKRANCDIKADDNFRLKVNNYLKLDTPYGGETEVIHYLEMLRDEIGWANLKKAVKNPLKGKKIGAYYGCLLLRPGKIMAFDDPENPKLLEDFIRAIGAEPVVYPYRNECCGGYISIKEKEKSAALCRRITESAAGFEADCLVTACPLCKYNLSQNTDLPIVYFTELLAEALGIKEVQE